MRFSMLSLLFFLLYCYYSALITPPRVRLQTLLGRAISCVCVLVFFAHSLICFFFANFFYCFTLVRRLLLILLLSVWRKRNWIKNASKSVIAATALLHFNTTLPDSLFLPLYLSAASALCDAQARSFFALFLAWRVLCARILVSYSYYLYSCKTCKCCYFFMLLQYLLCLVVFGGIKCGNRLAII